MTKGTYMVAAGTNGQIPVKRVLNACSYLRCAVSYHLQFFASGIRYFCAVKGKVIEVVLNVIFWGLTAALIISGFSIQAREIELVNGFETVRTIRNEALISELLILSAVSALLFYTNFINILSLAKGERKFRVVVGAVLLPGIAVAGYYVLEGVFIQAGHLPLPTSLVLGIPLFYFTISISYGLVKVWMTAERRSRQLMLDKKQSELTLLRNQLQPHFLFNALNNLLSLVDQQKSPLLAKSIDRLSGLLRYVVYETASDKVTIQKEIEFIRNYAELHLLRFDPGEVNFTLQVNGNYDQQRVEPGIFIAFVENAFKYGAEPEGNSEIMVKIDISEKNRVGFEIQNTIYRAMRSEPGSGTGIEATRARLKLVYPDRHWLSITENGTYRVQLTILTDEGDHRRR